MPTVQKVIAIDGPSASGKGTVASLVAQNLGFAYLDSGAIYRLCALDAQNKQINWENEDQLAIVAQNLNISFANQEVFLNNQSVEEHIRTEAIGLGASTIAKFPKVRLALLQRQQNFLTSQGLVADGRDMGSVVFPNACLKVFLTASATIRAQRRVNQLKNMGKEASFEHILKDIEARDLADQNRAVAPLKQLPDAQLLDTSNMSIENAVKTVCQWYQDIKI
ncbi:(d)CMP kinase [Neisseria sp. Ec49-e6-T10]|uniref:(d)CMP kinase n=1 Tax=Neisseria sp. Ec49-e6-T10 TaxID=3140744 RepID=UPI003EBE96C3